MYKMNRSSRPILLSLVLSFVFLSLSISSQTVDYKANIPRSGDVMTRQMLEYFPQGNNGQSVIWDFSGLSIESDSVENVYIEYFIDPDSSRLSVVDGNVILRYSDLTDTLQIIGQETALESICYDVPQSIMTYPFTYGSVISGSYSGNGIYCSRLNVHVSGSLVVESDAEGVIITAESDTLYNVLRVHTLRTGSISMNSVMDANNSDTTHVKQEIEERFEWYARGYRYPLYETTTITYYDDMTKLYDSHSASRISPEYMHFPDDSYNDSILAHDVQAHSAMFPIDGLQPTYPDGSNPENSGIIRYTVLTNGNTLTLDYDLDQDATLTFIICNKMGMLFVNRRENVKAGSEHTAEFDLSGLVPNDYILYINVNGTIYSEVFNVK